MALSCHKKIFICEIKVPNFSGESSKAGVSKIMKSAVLGIITGIQKSVRRTVYTVDDGTGSINCVLWNNESISSERICKVMRNLNRGDRKDNELNSICQMFLNKMHVNEDEPNYIHGDIICCMGVVKLVKGKLVLDISHHYKADDVNLETQWMLEVLSSLVTKGSE